MKILLLILTLLIPRVAFGAIAYVQSESAGGANVSSISTFPMSTTTGHLIICDVSGYASPGYFVDVTDGTNTYVETFAQYIISAYDSAFHGTQWYSENITGGAAQVFTANFDDNAFASIACKEVSGAATSGALDQYAYTQDQTGTTGLTSGVGLTTVQANELLAGGGIGIGGSAQTYTPQNSFTEDEQIAGTPSALAGLISAHRNLTAQSAAYAFIFDVDVASVVGAPVWVTTWKEAGGAPPATVRRRRAIEQ